MPYLIGFLLALAISLGARAVGLDRDRAFYPVVLAVIASYYVLFAVMDGSSSVVTLELIVMALFLAATSLGFRTSLWWVVGGLAAHGILDAFHGQVIANRGVPAWWPAFCAAYDLTAAATLAALLRVPRLRGFAMAAKVAAVAALLAAINGRPAQAQVEPLTRPHGALSIAVAQTRPVGALGRNIGNGYGLVAALLFPLDQTGLLSLRADVGVAEYGNTARRTAFSESVGGRVEVNVRTINTIVPVSVGLQLTIPAGPMLPYVHTGVGAQLFYTESSVEPTSGGTALASSINQSDVSLAWTIGGGLLVPLSRGPLHVLLDFSAQYIQGGRAQYLAPGSIVDLPGGHITVSPMESSTHLVVLRLGARIGL